MKHSKLVIFLLFLAFYLLLFLQFPLNHSLTGELDTLANLAMYKQLQNWIIGLFTGEAMGSICYPSKHVWVAFGADFGAGILHIFFSFLGFSDLWANWLFVGFILASNSFGMYLLASEFKMDRRAAIIAGLIFSCAHFTFGNLENPNTLVFFFCFYALTLFLRFIESGELKFFILSSIIGALQIYITPYVFLFYSVILAILILRYEPIRLKPKPVFIRYLLTAIGYAIVVTPFIHHFILQSDIKDYFNVVGDRSIVFVLAYNLDDFFRTLPNHLYMPYRELFDDAWLTKLKCFYLGATFWGVIIYGLVRYRKSMRREWMAMIIVGVLLAIGPYVSVGARKLFPSAAWPLYEYLNFDSILRVPARAFFIALIALSMILGTTLSRIAQGSFKHLMVSLVLLFMILGENIPMPFKHYDQREILQPDREWMDLVRSDEEYNNIVHLPSAIFDFRSDQREYAYMYWQSFHRQNVVNGMTAFIAPERMENNQLMKEWNQGDNLKKLIEQNGLDFILFHKDMVSEQEASLAIQQLNQHSEIKLLSDNERTTVFSVIGKP